MTAAWSTPADIAARLRRRWDDGSLLRSLAAGEPFPVLDVALRGPSPTQIGADLDAARRWVAALEDGSRHGRRYDLQHASIGGREVGRNIVPARARVTSWDQACALLGVASEVATYRAMLATAVELPAALDWASTQPLRALAVAPEWERMLAACRWLQDSRGSGRYLREITAPGVDTKFVERHRAVLAAMLGVSRTGPGFAEALGLRGKPDLVRARFAPGVLGLPSQLSEGTFRVTELATLPGSVTSALVVENEITWLSVDVPDGGIVLWGRGFEVARLGTLPWLTSAPITYWGDLDTHGFAILDQLRAWLPQTRSILMDRQTLLAHRDRWVIDPTPTSARLTRLIEEEADLYADLVTDRLGERVRLEQERIDWAWAQQRLPTPN
jgi:hypothetical protein